MKIMIEVDKQTIRRLIVAYVEAHGKKPSETWLKGFLKADIPYMYNWQYEFGDEAESHLKDAVQNFGI